MLWMPHAAICWAFWMQSSNWLRCDGHFIPPECWCIADRDFMTFETSYVRKYTENSKNQPFDHSHNFPTHLLNVRFASVFLSLNFSATNPAKGHFHRLLRRRQFDWLMNDKLWKKNKRIFLYYYSSSQWFISILVHNDYSVYWENTQGDHWGFSIIFILSKIYKKL